LPAALCAASAASASATRFDLRVSIAGIDGMHMLIAVICLFVFLSACGLMFWALFKHRKAQGTLVAHFHRSVTVEIVWTLIPILILIGMAWPAARAIVAMQDAAKPAGCQSPQACEHTDRVQMGTTFPRRHVWRSA